MTLRPQYHFRPTTDGVLIWDVRKLVKLASELPLVKVPLNEIVELDEPYWFGPGGDEPTCRRIAEHMKQSDEADLAFPIVLCSDGRVMDGMHRVVKAHINGQTHIDAVRLKKTPPPDYKDMRPEELP